MRLTRRKRIPHTDAASSSTEVDGGIVQVLPKPTQDEFAGSLRSRKHSIVYVFNKYLKLGSRQSFLPTLRVHGDAHNHLPPLVAMETTTSSSSSNTILSPSDISSTMEERTHCIRLAQSSSSEDPNLELWLKDLSLEDATIYQAKIAMNPKGWYRGSMSRELAQKKLQGQPDGSFLVRDSQTSGCHFTLSFRSVGITLHYRIENANGLW